MEQCVIQYPTNRNLAQSLQENAITVFGLRLNNSLPKYLRDIESVKTEKFKFEHKFLELIPDQPKMPNYMTPQHEATASSTSSLIWGLKEFNYEYNFSFLYKIKNLIVPTLSYIWGAKVFVGLPFKNETPYTTIVGSDNWHEKPHYSNIIWVSLVHEHWFI